MTIDNPVTEMRSAGSTMMPESIDEMGDEAVHAFGIARRQLPDERSQNPQGCLAFDDHQDHCRHKGERQEQEQDAGADEPRWQRGEEQDENRDGQNGQAVEYPLNNDRAEGGAHLDPALFRDEIGAGQLSQTRRDGDDGEKAHAGDGEQRELIDLLQRAQDKPPAEGAQELHEKQYGKNGGEVSIPEGPEPVGHVPKMNPPDREVDQQSGEEQAHNHFFFHQPVPFSGNRSAIPE